MLQTMTPLDFDPRTPMSPNSIFQSSERGDAESTAPASACVYMVSL